MSSIAAMKKSGRHDDLSSKPSQESPVKEAIPTTLSTRSDRVLAVTKDVTKRIGIVVKDPKFLCVSASAGTGAVSLAMVGGAVGVGTGAAVGLVPALFTFGLSIPAGAIVGGTVGATAGAGTGMLAGGVVGGCAYAYRVEIRNGQLYAFATIKDVANYTGRKINKSVKALVGGMAASKRCVQKPAFQATAGGAAGGAILLGAGGGAAGLTTGAVVGGAIGIVPAIFTFGLSIPAGAAIGGGVGLCAGTVAGGSAGALVGSGVGYGGYTKRDTIRRGVKAVRDKAFPSAKRANQSFLVQ